MHRRRAPAFAVPAAVLCLGSRSGNRKYLRKSNCNSARFLHLVALICTWLHKNRAKQKFFWELQKLQITLHIFPGKSPHSAVSPKWPILFHETALEGGHQFWVGEHPRCS